MAKPFTMEESEFSLAEDPTVDDSMDDLNDDTFGLDAGDVGDDFDFTNAAPLPAFFGPGDNQSGDNDSFLLEEEIFTRNPNPPQMTQPQPTPPQIPASARAMSLEEVEARMRNMQRPSGGVPPQHPSSFQGSPNQLPPQLQQHFASMQQMHQQPMQRPQHVQSPQHPQAILQHPPHHTHQQPQQPQHPPQSPQQHHHQQHSQHPQLSHPIQHPNLQSTQPNSLPIFNAEAFPALGSTPPKQTPQSPVPQTQRNNFSPSNQQQQRSGFAKATQPPFRPKWKESKTMMTADEIDSIIRMQEAQLNATGSNQFAEDYYHLMTKQRPEQGEITFHKPLFESTPRPAMAKRPDPLEGVLGRIPSHSVRAPRPLLQINAQEEAENEGKEKVPSLSVNSTGSESKVIQVLLLTIENGLTLLLGVQDIDLILRHPMSNQHFNVHQLRRKREQLTVDLFNALHIYTPTSQTLPHRLHPNSLFIYAEDDIFVNLSLVQKGKKLITRALPLLFQPQIVAVFSSYLRNLALLVSSPRIEMDIETTQKLFGYFQSIIGVASVPQTILFFQTVLSAHLNPQLIQILQSRFGMTILQTLMKRGFDLGLNTFSKDLQFAAPNSPGFHWKDTISSLLTRLAGHLPLLWNSGMGQT
eukprot:TRINITY_DN14956_c0_g1_i2.p1 TRINITY_DN14956_c0_g1~~TRINITY_DN14956_c0_g1_i2.p1  ORF type:complete len:638 (-),score=158.75 TRINITY_DN14956_c0_g1_i2:408-2321(-)